MKKAVALLMLLASSGCKLHPSNNDGGPINLAVHGTHVVVARGTKGIEVVDGATGEVVAFASPQGDSDSYDDVAAEDGIVLALDADCDRLSSFAIAANGRLEAVTRDLEVPTGPYSGIGFSNGKALVSGGIHGMTFVDVTPSGDLRIVGQLEAFRGQPDATVLPGGNGALLSTHFSNSESGFVDGAEFGVSSVDMASRKMVATRGLKGAGFSDGGGTPASWPVRANVQQDLAFVAHGGGLDILRIGSDLSLKRVAHLDLPIQATDVFALGSRAYVTGVPARVIRVDVSSPEAPVVESERPVAGEDANPTALVVSGDNVYVAANDAGLVSLPR